MSNSPHPRPAPRRPTQGAALLVAMVVLTVVATLAAGMVWQQWKAVRIEAAERGRVQSAWILSGALDWARLILREDARSGRPTSQHEPWATPLAEARLSSFLAIDQNNNSAADSDVEAFLAGAIEDAQSRYNLRNLLSEKQLSPERLAILEKLCAAAGLSNATAALLGNGLIAANAASEGEDEGAALMPQSLPDLAWLGLSQAEITALAPLVVLLPIPTTLNLNTAPREVLAAVIPGADLGSADRLVQARGREPLRNVEHAWQLLGLTTAPPAGLVDVKSSFFEVHGQLRLADRVLKQRSLVERKGTEVLARSRTREVKVTADLR